MLGWDSAALAQLQGGIVRPAVFFRMDLSPTPMRLWGGAGDFELPTDDVEPGGATYKGVGDLIGLPAVQQLINGQAERVTFTLSGVNPTVLALADEEADSVRGSLVRLGFMVLGEAWESISPTAWLWMGEADSVDVQRATSINDEGESEVVRSVSLSVGSIFTGRRRPPFGNFTDAEQRRRSADDRFCERVSLYSQGSTKDWPN